MDGFAVANFEPRTSFRISNHAHPESRILVSLRQNWTRTDQFILNVKSAKQSRPPFNKKSPIPEKYSWPELLKRDGDELEIHYRHRSNNSAKNRG
jgi:hypothetical protein